MTKDDPKVSHVNDSSVASPVRRSSRPVSAYLTIGLVMATASATWGQTKFTLPPGAHLLTLAPKFQRAIPTATMQHQIRDYLDGLPRLALVSPSAGSIESLVGLPDGITGQQIVDAKFVNTAAELAMLNSPVDIVWPGALVQGSSISNNLFAPIILSRSGGIVRIATNFVGTNGQAQSAGLSEISPSNVENAIRALISPLPITDSVASMDFDYATVSTLREAMVKLGVSYKSSSVSASLDASLNSSFNQNTIVAKFTQKFYTVAFDPDPSLPSPFFANSVSLDDVKKFASPINPPLFVSEVSYGRIILVSFTGDVSSIEMAAAIAAAYGSGGPNAFAGSLDSSYKEKLSHVQASILAVGSTGDVARTLITTSSSDELLSKLRDTIVAGIKYNPSTNPGAPIAMTMRYVGSTAGQGPYGLAIAQLVTSASPQVINLAAHEYCHGPFSVWDGPGGGPVDTGMKVNPGDKVRFQATGTNKSGVVFTDAYGPSGWYTWDAPSGTGYPITDRSPFALIARFGNGNQHGTDTTKWGYQFDASKQPSDWFYVGDATETTAGHADQQGRGTAGVGEVWLGTNDNNPYNGDPTLKFAVTVCVTPQIYQ